MNRKGIYKEIPAKFFINPILPIFTVRYLATYKF